MNTYTYQSPLAVILKGAASGLVGTAALTVSMQNAPMLMKKLGVAPEQKSGQAQESGDEPTAELAERVATGVLEQPIEEETKETAGQAIHWTYGAAWGMLYGVIQETYHLPPRLHGALFGTTVGLVASTVVPAMGLAPSPTEQPPQKSAMKFMMHLLYGYVTAATFETLSSNSIGQGAQI